MSAMASLSPFSMAVAVSSMTSMASSMTASLESPHDENANAEQRMRASVVIFFIMMLVVCVCC